MLTTLEQVKRQLQIPLEDTGEDGALSLLLASASRAIESYCGRSFKRQDYTQTASGGGRYLALRNYPVHEIREVLGPSGPITDYKMLDKGTNGILFRNSGWPGGAHEVTIEYSAGYILPGDGTPEDPTDLPPDLEYACLLFTKLLYHGQFGLHSERLGDHTVTFSLPNTGEELELPHAVRALAAPYVGRFG
ncbi:phage head-tail connector protein [Gorillibacterium sp. sgz5001074]|uniref:phage head-tail connector protein n=1 Tax=Gorillibacterium sp. sgz5001074 TaxID=3446695 RepID=UPI003F66B738